MYLNVEGTKSDVCTSYIERVAQHAKDCLMPNIRKLFVDIEVTDGFRDEEGINGETIYDEDRYATIVVDPDQSIEEFTITILHEMVHVKQYVMKELKDGKWKGEKYETAYTDSPWEIEAYELEQTLFDSFLNNEIAALT